MKTLVPNHAVKRAIEDLLLRRPELRPMPPATVEKPKDFESEADGPVALISTEDIA